MFKQLGQKMVEQEQNQAPKHTAPKTSSVKAKAASAPITNALASDEEKRFHYECFRF